MTVVVIGGGFSGAMTAAQLLRLSSGPSRVVLIEKRTNVGRGAAYGTVDPVHLLNVPAASMSVWPEDPEHFQRWLAARGQFGSEDFAPRALYGEYVEAALRETADAARPRARLEIIQEEAVALRPAEGGVDVTLASGRTLRADRAVLALGHSPPRALRCAGRTISDPWRPGALDNVALQDDVLVLGAGLTMVDVVLSLASRGHRGAIWAVSRRGLLPRPHADGPIAPFRLEGPLPRTVGGMLRGLRRAAEAGGDWRAAIDGLRPRVQEVWRSWPEPERRRFLRHASAFWDVHRHRLPPPAARAMDALRAAGRLKLIAARVEDLEEGPAGLRATLRRRGAAAIGSLDAAWVVNATGPETDLRRLEAPLVQDLLRQSLLRPDPLLLGADTAADGALIGRDGRASKTLFTLGPWLRGRFWETTAVPELREQARALAARVVNPRANG